MLSLSSISLHFGGLCVVEDASLRVSERKIYGLIGPNGAGKTTIFNLITGLLKPSAGNIDFIGQRLNGLPPHRIARLGIARTFQNIRLFREMTVLENVLVGLGGRVEYGPAAVLLSTPGYRRAERRDRAIGRDLLAKMGLLGKQDRAAETLSYGEQRRLEIARALATKPKLILLDEPAAGMNSSEKNELVERITDLNESGLTIVIIDHDMGVIMSLCHEIAVLDFGRVIARGRPDEIRGNPAVIEAYLGPGGGESSSGANGQE